MRICLQNQIQNKNIVISCTVGCPYCYARNNVKRWHMIDDFADPAFFPSKLKMMEKKRPQNFLLTYWMGPKKGGKIRAPLKTPKETRGKANFGPPQQK